MKTFKIHSLILCCLIFFAFSSVIYAAPSQEEISSDTVTYDKDAALAYASKHWESQASNDCANFVSACLQAGGLDIDESNVRGLYNTLPQKTRLAWNILTTEETPWGLTVNIEENSYIAPGDAIVYYCSSCDLFLHTVLVGGTDSEGYVTVYAHSASKNNERLYCDHWHDIDKLEVYSISLSELSEEPSGDDSYSSDDVFYMLYSLHVPSNICLREGEQYVLYGDISVTTKNNQDAYISAQIKPIDSIEDEQIYTTKITDEAFNIDVFNGHMDFSILKPGKYNFCIYGASKKAFDEELLLITTFEVV